MLYPLKFHPIYRESIWGGGRLSAKYGRSTSSPRCAESWEIADRSNGMSVVSEGALAGRTLRELIEQFGSQLLGSRWKEGHRFPFLLKILDAREPLSVQVHPDEESALHVGGEPKTEAWFVLEGGSVWAGLREEVTVERLRSAILEKTLPDLLQIIRVAAGDVVFIPGGVPHSMGPGCMVLEIQQNSDTTYRLYDWDRVDENNQPRSLQIEKALSCIRWQERAPLLIAPRAGKNSRECRISQILSSSFFSIEKIEISGLQLFPADAKTFQIFFILDGEETRGTTFLLPARSSPLVLQGPLSVLKIF